MHRYERFYFLQAKADNIKVIAAGTFLLLFFAVIIILFVYSYRKKHVKHLAEKEKLYAEFQKELLLAQLEMQEQTLKTISQEIHDNIGQTLSLAKLTLNAMDMEQDMSFEKLNHSGALVGKAIQDLRSLSKTMETETVLEAGLVNAIDFALKLLENSGAFQTELKVEGYPARFNPQKELIIFRIVQEAINNVIKHAAANLVVVTCIFEEQLFCLTIQDNGRGFVSPSHDQQMNKGSGLRNMRNRVSLIGGEFYIETSNISGTRLRLELSNYSV